MKIKKSAYLYGAIVGVIIGVAAILIDNQLLDFPALWIFLFFLIIDTAVDQDWLFDLSIPQKPSLSLYGEIVSAILSTVFYTALGAFVGKLVSLPFRHKETK